MRRRNRSAAIADFQVQHFYAERECHGEVDVAFGDFEVEAFGDQCGADQDQERQSEHFDGRMFGDEVADRSCGEHHHAD